MLGISEAELSNWVDRAYGTACSKGFHEQELSVYHMLMLVITEVSEVVEADRHNRHADLLGYSSLEYSVDSKVAFEKYVKDSVADEFADVCIRVFDMCGTLGLRALVINDSFEEYYGIFNGESLCEKCFHLCEILCGIDAEMLHGVVLDDDSESVEFGLCSALTFVFCMCKEYGIDIRRHIELKMRYNELRPAKHGKNY